MASGSKVKKGSNVRQLRSNRTAARTRAPQRSANRKGAGMVTRNSADIEEPMPCVRCRRGQPDFGCNAYDTWWVICEECGLEKNDLASKPAAIEWWNTRASLTTAPDVAATPSTAPICCYCDADLSCARCGREQPAGTK